MERSKRFTGCVIFTVIAVVFVLAGLSGMKISNRYETEGVDVVVTVTEYYYIGKNQSIYGTYTYQGRTYSKVNITNCRDVYIGKEIPCKVLLDNPFRADYVGTAAQMDKWVMWIIVAGLCVMAGYTIINYRHYCDVIDNGRLADGIIKSVHEKEKQFWGIVEFEDLQETKYTVELCFGKVQKIPGQRCQLKYVLDSKGNVEAYFYDSRRV